MMAPQSRKGTQSPCVNRAVLVIFPPYASEFLKSATVALRFAGALKISFRMVVASANDES